MTQQSDAIGGRSLRWLASMLLVGSAWACSSSNSSHPSTNADASTGQDGSVDGSAPRPDAGAGGPVVGPQDTHCSLTSSVGAVVGDGGINLVSQAACDAPDAGAGVDAGTDTSTACPYGDTNYNSSANDDDCKYHVSFTSTPVFQNTDVTFTVTAVHLSDGTPVTGAQTDPEVFLGSGGAETEGCPKTTRPPPNVAGQKTTEGPPGTYVIGPIRFDSPGNWTVRFHFYEHCYDQPESPHGHAAFLVHVP